MATKTKEKTPSPPVEYASAMDKIRDEMAKNGGRYVQVVGEYMTAYLLQHPEAEAAILPKLVKRYTFEAEGLVLRPFVGAAEVIAEGRALSICIGSYAENYMKGSTVICCLRRADDPDTPWRAIEFSTAGIRLQDRGYKNDREKGIPPQTKALLDRFWMAFDEAHQKKGAKSA